jgi:phage gp29-like protein
VPGLLSSLYTRVREWAGPRILPTGEGFRAGYERQLAIPQISQTRWLLEDLENAIVSADTGNLRIAARLSKSLGRDGTIHGVMSTRTLGLIQLPIRFRSDDARLVDGIAKDFRKVFPSAELALFLADALKLGVAVGEFVEVLGAMPVFRRVDPEWLWYRWAEDRWYYQSLHGLIPINPGDGRWVLHFAGGSVNPWQNGLVWPLGRAYIAKEHSYFYRENYNSKLANAARVAETPQAATEGEHQTWFQQVAAWGVNTVFATKPGYKVSLLESNGVGYQTFTETIGQCNDEITITIAGQLVTTEGGTGFVNASVFQAIRSDLIQADGDSLAATLMAQALPVWADWRFGLSASSASLECEWDTTPPKDQNALAQAMTAAATAVKAMNEVLAPLGKMVDVDEIARRYGVPLRDLEQVVSRDIALARPAPAANPAHEGRSGRVLYLRTIERETFEGRRAA